MFAHTIYARDVRILVVSIENAPNNDLVFSCFLISAFLPCGDCPAQ